MKQMQEDISTLSSNAIHSNDLNTLVDSYHNGLHDILDKHAPLESKEVKIRKQTPWSRNEILEEKRKLRRLENKARRTNLSVDKQSFRKGKKNYEAFLQEKTYESRKKWVTENKNNPRGMFKGLQNDLGMKTNTEYPPDKTQKELAESFSTTFDEKVKTIRRDLDEKVENTPDMSLLDENTTLHSSIFDNFTELSSEQVKKLVFKASNKFCELDPIPTYIIRDCWEEISPLLTKYITVSRGDATSPQNSNY